MKLWVDRLRSPLDCDSFIDGNVEAATLQAMVRLLTYPYPDANPHLPLPLP